MKYASEVIDLLAAYPGREFRAGDIIRYVETSGRNHGVSRQAIRNGVLRVLGALVDSGQVMQIRQSRTTARYLWLDHQMRRCNGETSDTLRAGSG